MSESQHRESGSKIQAGPGIQEELLQVLGQSHGPGLKDEIVDQGKTVRLSLVPGKAGYDIRNQGKMRALGQEKDSVTITRLRQRLG